MFELTHCVSEESMLGAIKKKVPKGTEEVNVRAFNVGRNAVEKLMK
jgi:Pyruvate/2-oxoacid:ferredoxin oxidoreductase gamma subunit